MTENKLSIPQTCRYCTYGNTTNPQSIWFTLHGYGQLAKYFIKNFESLNPEENLVIAPEGFHRFYLDGMKGRVGASWMTSEDRLTDISDYVHYLDLLYNQVTEKMTGGNHRLIVLGFSQGVATASRWMALGNTKPDAAVFWAGSFPPDLLPTDSKRWFNDIPTWSVVGDEDEYISEENIKRAKKHFESLGFNPEWVRYKGGHKIPKDAFSNISREIKVFFN
jgi:predicted esterase